LRIFPVNGFFFFPVHIAERSFFACSTMKTTSLFVPVLTAAFVSAHGFLSTVTIDGQAYTGNVPLAVDNPSIIRQVVTPFPNKGASNPALTCGPNSTTAALVAKANPGDSITFSWKGADLSNVGFYL
jgi:Auxiliary Activity family 9 (formerly GH61)